METLKWAKETGLMAGPCTAGAASATSGRIQFGYEGVFSMLDSIQGNLRVV